MKTFKGLSINPGKVVAHVCLYSSATHVGRSERPVRNDEEAREQIKRLEEALRVCSAELDTISTNIAENVGKAESEIFLTQKHIMNDPAIIKAIETTVLENRRSLEEAIQQVFDRYEEKFARMDDEYLRDRASDIGEIRRRLLDHLGNTGPGFICRGQQQCRRGEDRVVVAKELTADMMVHMNLERVLGIVTEHGGVSSHAAIIARSVGIPAVSGVPGVFGALECGARILVDGDSGTVVVNPNKATVQKLMPRRKEASEVQVTSTPQGMMVMANASLTEDVRLAASVNADGIGLFRTEIFFMRQGHLPSVEEQLNHYSEIVKLMGDRPVTFRLLDVGGDKELPFLSIAKESNPYLGWRGARFLLGSPDIFSAQARALVRLSKKGKVRILFPMVVDSRQLQQLCAGIREIILTEDAVAENIKLGAMFEVPSACMQAEDILKQVDFGSIGSNDLIQYLFAVDRDNELVSRDYDPEHPVLWEVLAGLSRAARSTRRSLSICGEMAGREGMPTRLIDAGIKVLSVSPRLIPRVRDEMAGRSSGGHQKVLNAYVS